MRSIVHSPYRLVYFEYTSYKGSDLFPYYWYYLFASLYQSTIPGVLL